ncbi:MAG: FAD-dependent oxidoreductase, partial [Deltaproteobacteria bacterium]|nr:FAD-dependent oxidoreductase [Deltaproteobacteria bacterium]
MATTPSTLTHIWTPLTIGSTMVKHRIMMPAETLDYGQDNILSDRHIAFYRERAKGGAALIITEQQGAHPVSKGSFYFGCTAWEKRVIPQYAKLADAVHEYGAKQFVQLFTPGVHDKGTMIVDEWHPLWAASRVPSFLHKETPMVMEQHHIDDLVKAFGESALNVKVSGLDGVEIHGAHSYGVGQFLSAAYNQRTDCYGGSVRKRCQFAIEIAEEIRRKIGDFTMGIRLSFDEFMGEGGITQEQAEEQVEVLAATGLFDFFNISGGGYHTFHWAVAPMGSKFGFMIPFGKRAKEIVGDRAKVFIVGRIIDLSMAEQIITDGAADMVAMARAHMADPFLVAKVREGREREIIKCVGANECVARLLENREVICLMNPASGRERQWGQGTLKMVSKDAAKKIIVVGGGPAGMKTAAVAAKRGHEVILLEKEQALGGHLNLIKQLPTRAEWQTAIDNLTREMEVAGVEVRLGVHATKEVLVQEKPDVVVCATGSTYSSTGLSSYRPERAGIPGVHQENVIDVGTATKRALKDPSSLGKRVVIVDETGAYLPLGLAEVLATQGEVDVEVITPHFFVGEDLVRTQDMPVLFPRLVAAGVKLTAQHFIENIEGNTGEVYNLWGGAHRLIANVDTVVISMMRTPNDVLLNAIRGSFREVHRVGDVVAPRKPAAVIYEGEKLG